MVRRGEANLSFQLKPSQVEQAGIELGLNQAETVSLELANKSQIIYFFIFKIQFEMDEQKKQNQTKLHQTKPFKF